MGYRKVDPRTKAAAVRAMRKAVDEEGLSARAAAHTLAAKYGIGVTTLQKYFAETQSTVEAPNPEPVAAQHTPVTVQDQDPQPEAEPEVDGSTLVQDARTTAAPGGQAGALSSEFTRTLEAISGEFVARLQEAALDDLIHKMQSLRDGLRR